MKGHANFIFKDPDFKTKLVLFKLNPCPPVFVIARLYQNLRLLRNSVNFMGFCQSSGGRSLKESAQNRRQYRFFGKNYVFQPFFGDFLPSLQFFLSPCQLTLLSEEDGLCH